MYRLIPLDDHGDRHILALRGGEQIVVNVTPRGADIAFPLTAPWRAARMALCLFPPGRLAAPGGAKDKAGKREALCAVRDERVSV